MNDIGINPSAVIHACMQRAFVYTSWGRAVAWTRHGHALACALWTCLESVHKRGCFHGLRKLIDKCCHQEIVPELSRTAVQGLGTNLPLFAHGPTGPSARGLTKRLRGNTMICSTQRQHHATAPPG